jgi:hypothetical protein
MESRALSSHLTACHQKSLLFNATDREIWFYYRHISTASSHSGENKLALSYDGTLVDKGRFSCGLFCDVINIIYDELSSGYFSGVWVLKADVSEHCVGSIFNRWWSWRWNRQNVPKRRLLILRRRGNTQKTIHHYYNTAKAWNLEVI